MQKLVVLATLIGLLSCGTSTPPSITTTYTVTPSVDANTSVTPSTPQTVVSGATQSFQIAAASGYTLDTILGTCPTGTLVSSTYTTGEVTANCGVSFTSYKNWTGVKQLGAASKTATVSISTTDGAGNVYAAGNTTGGLDGNTMTGNTDAVVAKFDRSGNLLWLKQLGASGQTTSAGGVAVDSSGNVFIAGNTTGALPTCTQIGNQDSFYAKYDSNGNFLSAVQLGVSGSTTAANSVALDSSGNIYLAGNTQGAFPGNSQTGLWDLWVAKYASNGTRTWITQIGNSASTFANSVAVDSSGNAYVAGATTGSLPGNTLTGTYDYVIGKYSTTGTLSWIKQLGVASSIVTATGVVIDPSGNAVITGGSNGAFPGNTLHGGQDFYFSKYDPNGNSLWIIQNGVAATGSATVGVATDSAGNIYGSGYTNGAFSGNTLTGTQDCLVVKYDSNGNATWIRQVGATGQQSACWGPSVDTTGNVFAAGYTQGGIDGNTLTGNQDMFVAKYNSLGMLQ